MITFYTIMKKLETIQKFCNFEQIQINQYKIHCKIRLKNGREMNCKKIYHTPIMKIQ